MTDAPTPLEPWEEMHEAALASLKPCPCCGGSEYVTGANKGVLTFVTCSCGLSMGEPGEEPETPILEAWNRRAPKPTPAREYCDEIDPPISGHKPTPAEPCEVCGRPTGGCCTVARNPAEPQKTGIIAAGPLPSFMDREPTPAEPPTREWLEKAGEREEGHHVTVGGLAADLGMLAPAEPMERFTKADAIYTIRFAILDGITVDHGQGPDRMTQTILASITDPKVAWALRALTPEPGEETT